MIAPLRNPAVEDLGANRHFRKTLLSFVPSVSCGSDSGAWYFLNDLDQRPAASCKPIPVHRAAFQAQHPTQPQIRIDVPGQDGLALLRHRTSYFLARSCLDVLLVYPWKLDLELYVRLLSDDTPYANILNSAPGPVSGVIGNIYKSGRPGATIPDTATQELIHDQIRAEMACLERIILEADPADIPPILLFPGLEHKDRVRMVTNGFRHWVRQLHGADFPVPGFTFRRLFLPQTRLRAEVRCRARQSPQMNHRALMLYQALEGHFSKCLLARPDLLARLDIAPLRRDRRTGTPALPFESNDAPLSRHALLEVFEIFGTDPLPDLRELAGLGLSR